MIRVFIGYDDNEKVAFSTLSHSLLKHSTQPLAITPIRLQNIKDIFVRERLPIQSTEFAFSRFIVPYLCNYSGHAIFMDCDMLARADISLYGDKEPLSMLFNVYNMITLLIVQLSF